MQIWLVIGGIIFYYFFVWDQIIDLNASRYTQAIRGLVGIPISWGCSALLFVRSLQNWYEWIALTPVVIGTALLGIIYSILHDGFDYGAATGPVLVILFGVCAFQVRTIPFVVVVLVSWIIYSSLELFAGNAKSGMFLVNNMSIGTAVFLGIFANVLRDYSLRREFIQERDLSVTEARVDELLGLAPRRLRILVSYRRRDSEAIAGRVRDRLVRHFGEDSVFMDIDSIPLGVDFRDYITSAIKRADILLVVIGPNWLGIQADGSSRLDDETDPVRLEIEVAQENRIQIIPILVNGAAIPPPNALPHSLMKFSFLNAASVDAGRDFHQHMDRLIRSLNVDKNLKENTPVG
jgi:TIR domain